ncbi:MAG: SUMF1/EgtB/PvdO family nonheme iron enzyme [Reichenbachiella sp.]|uniref:SUMF1/EgtB/PvdO family nonheme iron enzyme n=1 Tax=Reichenbachiella sp. TaxID=2184521 RepID=UPI003298D24A
MKKILLLLLFPTLTMAQDLHPVSFDPGCCSERTGIPIYSYNPDDSGEMMPVYIANKFSEKSIFYYGKYDPWKDSEYKDSELYNQRYIVPPGTIPIAKGKFLDQTEVANIHFEEFLFFMVKDSGRYKDRAYIPKQENKYVLNYYKNSEFSFFPVLAISFETAETYCEWRADQLNVGLKEMLVNESNKYKFKGRLPTKEEWLAAAGSPIDEIRIAPHEVTKKGSQFLEEDILKNRFAAESTLLKASFISYNVNLKYESGGVPIEIPQYIYSFEPNKRGFYNLYGNVKELVAEGYAFGGSYLTPNTEEAIFEEEYSPSYKTDVGFRCVVEITKR